MSCRGENNIYERYVRSIYCNKSIEDLKILEKRLIKTCSTLGKKIMDTEDKAINDMYSKTLVELSTVTELIKLKNKSVGVNETICPECGSKNSIKHIFKNREVDVAIGKISVIDSFLKCEKCNSKWDKWNMDMNCFTGETKIEFINKVK